MKPGFLIIIPSVLFIACNSNPSSTSSTTDSTINEPTHSPKLREENIYYRNDSVSMNGYVAYDSNREGRRPGVLVVHEWWGLNDYPKMRARKLAELGYVAMAIDMYGGGETADNPTDAGNMAAPFYSNMQRTKSRFDAALKKLKTFSQVDTNRIAAIGYCFGGGVVLNAARLGEDLKGVVSFHGTLLGAPADKKLLKAKILVCHGEADQLVKPPDVAEFKKQMDSIGADYTFKQYAGAQHAFTNPKATAMGEKYKIPIQYNGAADTASWNDMKTFLARVLK